MINRMTDGELRAFAAAAIRGSRRHLAMSAVLVVVVAAYEVAMHASLAVFGFVACCTAVLAGYNVLRIRAARAAQLSPEAGRLFVARQRRSHLIRGYATLLLIPVVAGTAWVGALRHRPTTTVVLVGLIGGTLFLAWGWFRWFRALPSVRRWPDEA